MKITVRENDTYVVATVEGSLTNEFLKEFEIELAKLFQSRRNIILDLSRLTFILSSGLGLLLSYHVSARREKLHFIISGLNVQLQRLFTITDLNKHLDICESLDDALVMVKKPVS